MTTILKDNKGIYTVHFNEIECNNIQYNSFELAQSLCRMRLGSNILFIRIPYKTKWIVVNNFLNIFV
jgi:hypothetical protein